jgi:hypothetical protein
MRLPNLNRLWILAMAGAVVLSACGGGGGGAGAKTTTTTRPLTPRTTLTTKGNSACRALAANKQQLVSQFLAKHQVTDTAATRDFLINSLAPAYDQAVGALHRLYLPTEDPTEWAHIMDGIDSDLAAWRQTIDSNPASAVNGDPFADIAPRMAAFGLTDCAKF